MIKTQRSDTEKKYFIEKGKRKLKKKASMKLLDKIHKYKTMSSYSSKCQKNKTENISPYGKTMILSNCVICASKKSKFIKKQANY